MKNAYIFCLAILTFSTACARHMPPKYDLPPNNSTTEYHTPYIPYQSTNKTPPPPAKEDFGMADFPMKELNSKKTVIVLDAGHGGEDFGTQSTTKPKFHEKNLNMSTAQLVKNFLEQFGYSVILTRSDDKYIALDQRSLFANEKNSQIFVSIHFNSAPSKDAEGIEVFYYNQASDKMRSSQSKMLAEAILDQTIKNTGAKSRGVKHGNYAVIRETKMPAALIEGGFLTNDEEMEKIKNASYLKSLSLGIAKGIHNFVRKENILRSED